MSTKINCSAKDWSDRKERLTNKTQANRAKNDLLDWMQDCAEDVYWKYYKKHFRVIPHDLYKEKLLKKVFKVKVASTKKLLFLDYVRTLIERREGQPNIYSRNTISGYNTALSHLEAYENYTGDKLSFKSVGTDFEDEFANYLYDSGTINSPNTVIKYLKRTLTFLNAAKKDKVIKGHDFSLANAAVRNVLVRKSYLTISEIEKIYKTPLSGRREEVRDLLVAACFHGLRFQDWHKPKIGNIKKIMGFEIIEVPTQKTDEYASIPVHPILKEILNKHWPKLPETSSNQKTNDLIKEICKQCGITEMEQETYFSKGVMKIRQQPKYKLISCHTMRRSAATNMYLAGVPLDVVRRILGHTTVEQTKTYISATGVDFAVMVAHLPYFNNQNQRPT